MARTIKPFSGTGTYPTSKYSTLRTATSLGYFGCESHGLLLVHHQSSRQESWLFQDPSPNSFSSLLQANLETNFFCQWVARSTILGASPGKQPFSFVPMSSSYHNNRTVLFCGGNQGHLEVHSGNVMGLLPGLQVESSLHVGYQSFVAADKRLGVTSFPMHVQVSGT